MLALDPSRDEVKLGPSVLANHHAVERSIPNNKKSAARGGSARTNALAIDLERLVTNALNKQNQQKQQGRKKKKNRNGLRSNTLNLHQGQSSNSISTQFFSTSPGSTPGGCRVRGRELVDTVTAYGNGVFDVVANQLNPVRIPRLSAYGAIYEMYCFHSAKMIFQSNQPTTASGVVAMAVDYDINDPSPPNIKTMMRNISSSMSNIYSDSVTLIDKRLCRLPRYYITSDTADSVSVNQAAIYYATEGFVNSDPESSTPVPVGYLFIEYDIEFFTPQ